MTDPDLREQNAALDDLFKRIGDVAKRMGGEWYPDGLETEAARMEFTRRLHIEMPDDFVADFEPITSLNADDRLAVRARRYLHVTPNADWSFTFSCSRWLCLNRPLTEEHIRRCLTPERPRMCL